MKSVESWPTILGDIVKIEMYSEVSRGGNGGKSQFLSTKYLWFMLDSEVFFTASKTTC